jgi:hypothetical protein
VREAWSGDPDACATNFGVSGKAMRWRLYSFRLGEAPAGQRRRGDRTMAQRAMKLFLGPYWSLLVGEGLAALSFGASWTAKGAEWRYLFGGSTADEKAARAALARPHDAA